MKKTISADQVLHGYANGHQMLAGSCELNLDDRKKIDELSDLNGRCDGHSFVDYYTGYPIGDGKKYVIARTWYAHEMKRPGCVWTHSIIFNTEDISKLSDVKGLMRLFKRPNSLIYHEYMRKIFIDIDEAKKSFPDYDDQKLQYMIYTIFSSSGPSYVAIDETKNNFDNEFFMTLNAIPCEILKSFTFCTMSYDVRKYANNEFEFQIYSEKDLFRFQRKLDIKNVSISFEQIKKFPFWVQSYKQCLLKNTLKGLRDFVILYGEKYLNLYDFNRFTRLYFVLQKTENISLTEYFESIRIVFPLADTEIYQITVELILDNEFFMDIFKNKEYQILELMDMKKINLDNPHKEKLDNRIIKLTPEKLYPILCKYISGQLKVKAHLTVERIIMKLKPKDLKVVSHMDENICMVLLHLNSNLLLSKDIWKMSKSFQRSMIYECRANLEPDKIRYLISIIFNYDSENISEDLYAIYGNMLIPILYEVISTSELDDIKKLENWTTIFLRDQNMLLKKINILPFRNYRKSLFLKIDMSDRNFVRAVEKDIWIMLYKDIMIGENNIDLRVKYALQFFPAIFDTSYRFDDDFVEDIVGVIYRKLKSNTLSFDDWNRFQHILPHVEMHYSWDKCLRVRNALEQKGYNVSLVEN